MANDQHNQTGHRNYPVRPHAFLRSSEFTGYDLSNSQISPTIFPKRLADKDFVEYSCIESLAFELQLNISIRCFLVHFLNEKPGDKT